jgi:holo-[acyl-carrier protein] synthase
MNNHTSMAHGVDVVDIDRFRALLERHKERVLERLFSTEERAYCESFKDGTAHWAVRFAAKEAMLKALGTGLTEGMRWRDIEICRDAKGKPTVRLSGEVEKIFRSAGYTKTLLSLSHSRAVAIASVILL